MDGDCSGLQSSREIFVCVVQLCEAQLRAVGRCVPTVDNRVSISVDGQLVPVSLRRDVAAWGPSPRSDNRGLGVLTCV